MVVEVKIDKGVVANTPIIKGSKVELVVEVVKEKEQGGEKLKKILFFSLRFYGKNAQKAATLNKGDTISLVGEMTSALEKGEKSFRNIAVMIYVHGFALIGSELKTKPMSEQVSENDKAEIEKNIKAKLEKEKELAEELGLPDIQV